MGLFCTLSGIVWNIVSISLNRASRLQMLMGSDGFPENIRFTGKCPKMSKNTCNHDCGLPWASGKPSKQTTL